MAEPLLKREGNLRFVGMACRGWPADPLALAGEVRSRLVGTTLVPHGPASVLFSLPPEDLPPDQWECQVGTAVTGLPATIPGLSVEDYRGLHALSQPHRGAVRDLPATLRALTDHARGLGHRLRPYWRLALRCRRLADGNLLPVADVAVFLDR